MCGLAGFLSAGGHSTDDGRRLAAGMAERLRHRGPDDGGVWADEHVALGHRRLAILDVSPLGAQPMVDATGRYVIAFNGEIYNHLDLRESLARSGAAPEWRGHSDTETLLAAIAHWGLDDALKAASGMFALAVWDRQEKILSLARDRMGEKPLYWGIARGALVFGSELKALQAFPAFSGEICREAVAQYLRFAYVPAPRSIYRGTFKLEPGTILSAKLGPPLSAPDAPFRVGESHESISIRRYWSLSETIEAGAADSVGSDAEAVDALEDTLGAAVRRQLISDVPLGAFLSGGVDSSAIVALMQTNSSQPVKTFTVGFDDPAYDESTFAAQVAAHLGTDHQTLHVTDADARAVIPQLPEIYDEPFGDSSQIPTYLVCKAARESATVALSGDAGDELFSGYNRYTWGQSVWIQAAKLGLHGRNLLSLGIRMVPASGWNAAGALHARLRPGTGGVSLPALKAQKLAGALRGAENVDDFYRNIVSQWDDPAKLVHGISAEPVTPLSDPLPDDGIKHTAMRMMVQDMRCYLPGDILCKLDRAAMAVSLETRAPFLDPAVVALAARLPIEMKLRGAGGKWALRQVLYRHVPRELIERPKVGFSIPLGEWLRNPLRGWAGDLLAPIISDRDSLLRGAPIEKAWREHLTGRRDWSDRLWVVLMLQSWRRANCENMSLGDRGQ